MSRYKSSGAYSFHIQKIGPGDFILSWTVDHYYNGSRLRYPRTFSRYADPSGAKRFCEKHGLEIPNEKNTVRS